MTLVWLASGWLTGIALGSALWLPPALLVVAGLAGLAILGLWRDQPTARRAALAYLFLVLGAWRYQRAVPLFTERTLAFYNDRGTVLVQGVVCGYPDQRDRWTKLVICAQSVEVEGRELAVKGRALVRVARYPAYEYGDELKFRGKLQWPPVFEGFSYREYLARQGVHSVMEYPQVRLLNGGHGSRFYAYIYGLRRRANIAILRAFPEPEASLLAGILLGLDKGISPSLSEDFNRTGTSHIIAISG